MANKKISSRGVKPGAKRGPYNKKEKLVLQEIKEKLDMIEDGEPLDINLDVIPEPELALDIENELPDQKNDLTDDAKSDSEKPVNEFSKNGEEQFNDWKKEFSDVTPVQKDFVTQKREEIANDENKPKQKRGRPVESKLNNANAALVNGTMLIAMCDFFFPGAFKLIYKYIFKNQHASKVKHADVKLTEDQVNSISDVSDEAAKVIFEKVNPIVLFALSMSIMYGLNFKMAVDNIEDKSKLS